MNEEKSKTIAEQYLLKNPIEHKDYVWVVGKAHKVAKGWYFDFQFRCLLDFAKGKWEKLAGTPGFTVMPDKTVKVVSWDELPGFRHA